MNRNKLEAAKNNLKAVLILFNLDSLHDYKQLTEAQGEYIQVLFLGVYEEVLKEMMELLPDFEYEELRRNPDNDFLRVNIRKKGLGHASTLSSSQPTNS